MFTAIRPRPVWPGRPPTRLVPHLPGPRGALIHPAREGDALAQADELLVEFARFMADLYADVPAIADDMRALTGWGGGDGRAPAEYCPPSGALLLASRRGKTVGVAGVRAVEGLPGCAELKRLYVRPGFRGEGIARDLLARAISEARRLGYCELLLETGERFVDAVPLYRRFGFREIPSYRTRSPDVDSHFLSMSLDLN